MRGGRSFSSRGNGYKGGNTSENGYRGHSSSYRGSSSGGRNNDYNNSRYGGGGGGNYSGNSMSNSRSRFIDKGPSSGRFTYNRSYERSSSYNRNSSRGRDESPDRKRSRHDGGNSRRDFGGNVSNFSNRYGNNASGGSNASYRRGSSGKHTSPARSPFRSSRASSDNRSKERMGPPSRLPATRKFSATGSSVVKKPVRGVAPSSRGIRRSRILTTRTIARSRLANIRQRDSARRIKIARMRSTMKKQTVPAKTSNSDADDKDHSERKSKMDTEETTAKASTESPKRKTSVTRKTVTKKATTASADTDNDVEMDNNVEKEDEENDESKEKENNIEKVMKEGEGEGEGEGDNNEQENGDQGLKEKTAIEDAADTAVAAAAKKDSTKDDSFKRSPKKYIKLTCVHCRAKCVTFQEYQNHLYSRMHKAEIRRVGLRQKAQLARMRLAQRNAQREIEESSKDTNNLDSLFCYICRLNYRSPKAEHQASEAHKNMKQFLMPYCKICRISFKSALLYENHRCSLEHIKRKARAENDTKKDEGEEDEDNEEDALEVDLEQFFTVDSVGDVDGAQIDGDDASEKQPKTNVEINVGAEHVKKIEVNYCELCRYYLPHQEEHEISLKKHCGTRGHLRAYLRYKENQTLRLAAEQVHRRDQEKQDDKDKTEEPEKAETNNGTVADKSWEDTDKTADDITKIKTEDVNEDEDEDSRATTERYDRFKNSEKLKTEKEDSIKEEEVAATESIVNIDTES